MNNIYRIVFSGFTIVLLMSCATSSKQNKITTVTGEEVLSGNQRWLSHEHILVDFSGADSIDPKKWNHDSVITTMSPYLEELKSHQVKYFVDPTPAYLGRDVVLLEKLAKKTGLTILTNTGFYGAFKNKYIPSFALNLSAEDIAKIWIDE